MDSAEEVSFGRYGVILIGYSVQTPMVFDTITNDIVHELLARNNDYLN